MSEQSEMLDSQWSEMPVATSTGGFFDTGAGILNNVADKWLRYQESKQRNDLEYSGYDQNPLGRTAAAVPSWVWVIGAVGLGLIAYKAIR